jgi:serine/threonine protein kinase
VRAPQDMEAHPSAGCRPAEGAPAILDDYEMLGTIGQGGMGVVHRARHRPTGRLVALKVMRAEAAANAVLRSRFAQEFAAASRLSHPNVVKMLACDVQRERPFLVMELVEGLSLGERISREGALDEDEALDVIRQVADGLGFIHRHGLIHRDVKPDNVLLTAEDGVAKLTDLGLVKDLSTSGELTSAGIGLGTAAYVAPEQFEDAKSATVLSDVYALGATLYHALTGVAPFRGRVHTVILKKKITNDFATPLDLIPSLRSCVSQAICRALDSLPERRQQSSEEFLCELQLPPPQAQAAPQEGAPVRARREVSEAKGAERRRARRFPSLVSLYCAPVCDRRAACRGMTRDVSTTGALIRLPRSFEPGALLVVELLDEQDAVGQTVMVSVRWIKKVTEKEWEAGCSFDREISEDELNAMLGNLTKTDVLTPRETCSGEPGLS